MTQTEPRKLTIDIWSDVMCPWCLIGWGQLQKALKLLDGEIAAEVRWHAFELNPDMAAEGEDRTAHIARKYGRTAEQSRGVQDQMRGAAEAAGVSLDYEGKEPAPPAMMWNTFDAHKLLTWAGETYDPVRQTALKQALFAAHFNHRRRIGDRDVLLDVAESAGFDRAEAAAALDSAEWAEKVRTEERAAWEMNITGVPAMVVAGRFLIPGAQDAQTYADVLRKVAEKVSAEGG